MIKFKKVSIGVGVFGMKAYDLLDPTTGESVPFYTHYLHKIISEQVANGSQSQNTIDAIASDLKVFLEYVNNAQEAFFDEQIDTSSTLLSEIILSFPDYLALGEKSRKPIARATALRTDRKPLSKASIQRYLSTVNGFVAASAIEHERLKAAQKHALIDIDVEPKNIHKALLQRRELSITERNRLRRQSVLSQVICGGSKYTKTQLFKSTRVSSSVISDYKYFPPEHIIGLLDAAPSYQDRALWSLMLGAGLRISEASQLLVGDVDIVNENLKVFSYRDRVENFEAVSNTDLSKLSFKGRATEDAFFIEPFGSIFFESITQYLKHERPRGLTHNYLFVTNSNNGKGRPLFAASRTTRNEKFKKAQKTIGCPIKENGRAYTVHSLRHFYGYWLLNFHITEDGERFSLLEVQMMMGHQSISSTKKYAVTDRDIAKEKMKLANLVLQNKSTNQKTDFLVSHKKDVMKALTSGVTK